MLAAGSTKKKFSMLNLFFPWQPHPKSLSLIPWLIFVRWDLIPVGINWHSMDGGLCVSSPEGMGRWRGWILPLLLGVSVGDEVRKLQEITTAKSNSDIPN